jgi:presenilin-like A22 family membrane protease
MDEMKKRNHEEKIRMIDGKYLRFLLANYIPVTFLGILFGSKLFSYNIVVIEGGEKISTSFWIFGGVILISAFILLLIKLKLSRYLYLLTEYGGLFLMAFFIFSLYMSEIISVILSACLIALRLTFKPFKPYAVIIMASGAASLLGSSLHVLPIIVLMLLLSVYDVLAVKKTHHMQIIAQDVFEKQGSQIFVSSGEKEIYVLGAADIIFPCVLAVSSYLQYDLPTAALTSLFGLIGLTLASRHTEAPALPYASLSIVGFVMGLIIF